MSKVKPRTKLVAIHPVHGYAIPPPQDVKVSRRNARERNRVKTVNSGFEMLKRHIPSAAPVKKMSKVNILTQAVDYIEALKSLLQEAPTSPVPTSKPSASTSSVSGPGPYPPLQAPVTSYPPSYPPDKAPSPYTPAHFYPSPYPSPAPPLTPISPNTMYYPQYRSYESGYDSHGDNLTELDRKHSWHHPDFHHHHSPYPKPSPASPPSSVPQSPATQNTHYLMPVPAKPDKAGDNTESSGEEDDILDAIAEWQQH